jgi:hypothetical protein
VAVLSDLLAAIRWTAHLDPDLTQQLPKPIDMHDRALLAHSTEAAIHCFPRHLGIPRTKRLTASETEHVKTKATLKVSEYAPWPRNVGNISQKG